MKKAYSNPFPNKEQEILLKTALFPPADVAMYWKEWNNLIDFESFFDIGSFRLMPLVYKNLLKCETEIPFIHKLKNIYLQNWYKNQQLFHEGSKIVSEFELKNIKTIILKGAALSHFAYKDKGVRPMSDIDIMVPYNQAVEAMKLLKSNKWKAEFENYIEYNLKFGRSMMFRREDGFELDLHWHPFFEAQEKNKEADFWDKAIPFELSGIQSQSLCPADMLLEVIVHGLRYNPIPPIRWIPDSVKLILNCHNEIDWDYFIDQTRKYRVALKVKKAFDYLKDTFNLSIPEAVDKNLKQIRISYAEQLVYFDAMQQDEDEVDRFFNKLYKLFLIYLRQTKDRGLIRQMIGFWRFLRFRTAGKNAFAIVWYYMKKK